MNSLRTAGAARAAGIAIPPTTLRGVCRPPTPILIPSTIFRLSYLTLPFTFAPNRTPLKSSLAISTSRSESKISMDDRGLAAEDVEDGDDVLFDDELIEDELFDDEDLLEDEIVVEDAEVFVGDGAAGGGVSLAGTLWDKEALTIAEQVCKSMDGGIKLYAFRTLVDATIQVRIEKLSAKSSSPGMSDIEAFSTAYRARREKEYIEKSILRENRCLFSWR